MAKVELKLDRETQFLQGLLELQYGQAILTTLQQISNDVPWARGWPTNSRAFWNAEAFMWQHKIDQNKRDFIAQKLQFLAGGKNVDIGCGSYSYISSIGVDFSEKMLQFNDRCYQKIQADLEKKLPLADHSVDSVTAVFVLNYISHYEQLLSEIKRIVRLGGVVMIVLSGLGLNQWQKQKEVNNFSIEEWQKIFEETGFKVDFSLEEGLWFFKLNKAG